jgi:hypothetical protein
MRPQIKDIVNEIISPLNLIKVLAINGTNRKTQHADLNCKDVLKYSTVETAELSGAELLGLHCYPSAKVTELVQSLKVKVSEAKNLNYHLEGAEKNPLEVYLLARYLESYQSQDELFHYGNEFLANLNLHYKRNSLLEMICATVLGSESLRFGAGPLQSLIRDVDDKVEVSVQIAYTTLQKRCAQYSTGSVLEWMTKKLNQPYFAVTIARKR